MKLTCYIIDDEPLAIEVLRSHLEKIDGVEIQGTFQNALKAFGALHDQPADLLFLDIQMPGLTGIKLLQSLKNPPQVIFTTAYREYAVEGFELDVTDYLLKPISFERLLKAMNRVFAREHPVPRGVGKSEEKQVEEVLYVQVGKKKIKIRLNDILFIESRRDYVHIKTVHKEISAHQTLSYLEKKLPSEHFLRIHRSFIVRLDKIESWSSVEVGLPGTQLPVGRTYKNEALKTLEERSRLL